MFFDNVYLCLYHYIMCVTCFFYFSFLFLCVVVVVVLVELLVGSLSVAVVRNGFLMLSLFAFICYEVVKFLLCFHQKYACVAGFWVVHNYWFSDCQKHTSTFVHFASKRQLWSILILMYYDWCDDFRISEKGVSGYQKDILSKMILHEPCKTNAQ